MNQLYKVQQNVYYNELLYTNIDQTLVNSLHGLFNCEKGGLDCHVITTEYIPRVQCIHLGYLIL